MRTRFIVLYLLFCIVQIFPQQDDFQKFIENKLNSRTLTTYEKINSEFLLTQSIEQEWIISAWQNVSRSTTSYDSSNTGYLITTEIWDNNQWVNESQFWYVYDENDLVTEELVKAWVNTKLG